MRDACAPEVRALRYEGAATAAPVPQVLAGLADPALECVVLCPSNPYLSIDPMRAIPGLAAALGPAKRRWSRSHPWSAASR